MGQAKMNKLAIIAGLSAILTACATAPELIDAETGQSKKTVMDYADDLTLRGDGLDDRIEVNSKNTDKQQFSTGIFGHAAKPFVRAYKDKTTGATTYQVYVQLQNIEDWLRPYQANLGSPLMTLETTRLDFDVDCSTDVCWHYEDVIFTLPESFFKELDKKTPDLNFEKLAYRGGVVDMRLKTRSGTDVNFSITEAELLSVYYGIAVAK